MSGKSVTNVISDVTKGSHAVIGYLTKKNLSEKPFGLIVDSLDGPGYSGLPYWDEHGRLYILHGSFESTNDVLKGLNNMCLEKLGHRSRGCAILSGPLELK